MSRPELYLPPGTTVETTTRTLCGMFLLPATAHFAKIVIGVLAIAWGLASACSRWVTAIAPRSSQVEPYSCWCRRAHIANHCGGTRYPCGAPYCSGPSTWTVRSMRP